MDQHIIIIAEQAEGKLAPVTFELIEAAKILHGFTGNPVKIIICGHNISTAAEHLAKKTGMDILAVALPDRSCPDDAVYKTFPADLIFSLNPSYICVAHDAKGLDFAPGLAIEMDAACVTGVEKISFYDGSIGFSRSVFSDKISEHVTTDAGTTVLTIQPGSFKPESAENPAPGKVSAGTLADCPKNYHLHGYKDNMSDTSALDGAGVIVSAGNGIGRIENLELINQLAELFPKAAVGGSRPVCDRKWLPYNRQVGVTGASVRPKLYIACGISGSSQHTAGMRDSKFIVAINKDPRAAIFNIADICIIEDLTSFIPSFIQAVKEEPVVR